MPFVRPPPPRSLSLSAEEYLEADALAEEIRAMEPAAEEIRQIQVRRRLAAGGCVRPLGVGAISISTSPHKPTHSFSPTALK